MAFNRPTLETIIKRVQTDIKGGLGITTILSRSFVAVLSRAVAGVSHVLHGHVEEMSKQIFVDQADSEYLERFASIYGLKRVEASYTQFEILITGTDGKIIPADTILQSDAEFEYKTDSEGTISGGEILLNVTAQAPGNDTLLEIADPINFISPILGVESITNISQILIEGADTEDDETLRERILNRIQQPPSGGSANDYIQKCLEVPGITRAYVFPLGAGLGTVVVKCLQDGNEDIIPSSAKNTEVQNYLRAWAPVTADVTVSVAAAIPLNMTISLSPNTTAVQLAVTEEIKDLIYRNSDISGGWKAPGETFTGKLLVSQIREAISTAAGEEDHTISLINAITPADIIPNDSEVITMGTLTFEALV